MLLADKDRPRFVNLPPPQINRAVVSDVTHWTKGEILGGTKQFDNVPTTDVGKALRDLAVNTLQQTCFVLLTDSFKGQLEKVLHDTALAAKDGRKSEYQDDPDAIDLD